MINRRQLNIGIAALGLGVYGASSSFAQKQTKSEQTMSGTQKDMKQDIDWAALSNKDWKARLSPEAYHVLRKDGTERPGSSALNTEKRKGTYICAGCALPLFSSASKYESGTGWPSFFDHLPGAVVTKRDFKLIVPRTEYHCARCEGHQGHVFKDGPQPTGLRYCNNGVALGFIPETEQIK